MSYENPRIPEGINSGRRRPLRDLLVLGGGALVLVGTLVGAILLSAHLLGPLIPFAWERALAPEPAPPSPGAEAELRALGDRVAAVMDLPAGMAVSVRMIDHGEANAFATVGGQVFVTRRLVEIMPDDNALAFVVGHEIAHVRHRDVARGAAAAILLGLAAAAVGGDGGFAEIATTGGLLGGLSFSRSREEAADAAGLEALVRLYGHGGGYADALRALRDASLGMSEPPVLLASHPRIDDRIAALDALAAERGWPTDGTRSAPRLTASGGRRSRRWWRR